MNKHVAKSVAEQSNEEFSSKPTVLFIKVSCITFQLFKLHYAVCGVPRPWLSLPFSHQALAILLAHHQSTFTRRLGREGASKHNHRSLCSA